MLKKLMIGLGLLIVVGAIGVYYLSQNAGKFVQAVIEEQGTRVAAVAVKLDGVDLSLTDLKASIRGLTVANPTGFATQRAVSLGEVSVTINKDWSPNLIVIDEIMVRAPEITYEIGSNGSNIATIQKNVQTFMKKMDGGIKAPDTSKDEKSAVKVIIKHFYIKGGKVNVSASLFKGKTMTTPLPDIHLTDIGKKSGGATPAEVIDKVMASITKSSGTAARSLDLSKLGLSDISGKAAKATQDILSGASSGAGQVGAKAKDALKGLFGN